jgi:hypothetical protein
VRVLAEAVAEAHALAPDKWGVSMLDRFVRLNLGRVEILTIGHDVLHLLVYQSRVPDELRDLQHGDGYASVPGSCFVEVSNPDIRFWDLVRPAWREAARRAAQTPRHSMTRKAHSPGVLEYLRQAGWKEVPNPLSAA